MANRKAGADFIDFHALMKSYLSKWYVFVITIVICLILGFIYTRVYTQPMAVRANILISQDDDGPFGASSTAKTGNIGSLFGSSAYVEDEVFVISSHSLYRNVAKSLGINRTHMVKTGFLRWRFAYPDFPIDVVADTEVADTLTYPLTFEVDVNKNGEADIVVKDYKNKKLLKAEDVKLPYIAKTPYGEYTVTPTKYFPKGKKLSTEVTFTGYENAAETLTDQVIADLASKKSNVITLFYDTPNSAYGSAVLNEVLKKYNERGIYEKNLQGKKTASFLEDRIQLMGNDLNQTESAIEAYKQKNNITDIEADVTVQQKRLTELRNELFQKETEVEILRITRDFFADSVASNELVPTVVDNEALQRGIDSINGMVLRRIELSQIAKGDNYALKRLDARLAMMKGNLYRSSVKVLDNATRVLNELRAEKAKSDAVLGSVPTQEREYLGMKRQQLLKEHLYLFLLERQEENSMMLANAIPKGKVIDEAYTLSEPLGIGKKAIMVIALLAGILLPFIFIYLYRLIRNKFESRQEVERNISAPILGEMCTDRSGRKMVVTEHDTTSATELFRLLRSNLQFMLSDASDRVVLVTSTVSGEGKSFISSNLAASLSLLEGKRTLLVGMDIRNPQLENYLDFHPRFGLTNYLSSSTVTLQEIINPLPGYKSLDVIVAGPIPPNPSELLASKKVDELFATLRTMYDYVVVDSAPVGMVSDTFTLDRIADATVYVTRVNYSSMNDLHFIENIYEEKRLKKLSVVVNGTHSKKGYGYGYGRKESK
ncbi:MAG: polysaccharide biosynthesis tyrosine autokinase [Muribaculaceae bacterium]|nr:polysaccharide biosynthesis tyrosine autokinase [Muribaculaceae bacterium]